MTDLGGLAYMTGEAWAITWSPSPHVDSSDTVKLIFGGLTITGTVSAGGNSVAFSYTAAQTATLTAYYKYDARITVNDTARTESYDFTTGASVTGTATYPSVTNPLSIEAGAGVVCTPDPILTTGTVGLSPIIPEPGVSNRVIVGQCWNPLLATPAYVNVYRESFYIAAGGTNPEGDIELKSSGVSFPVGVAGFLELDGGLANVRYTLVSDNVRNQAGLSVSESGAMTLVRGTSIDAAGDGYFVSCDYVDA